MLTLTGLPATRHTRPRTPTPSETNKDTPSSSYTPQGLFPTPTLTPKHPQQTSYPPPPPPPPPLRSYHTPLFVSHIRSIPFLLPSTSFST
ncbi:hypothetical protein E2C01_067716 [Portunus trituberculatus]|uniref:Uncharacterized protein n=1 Tax=Portunus trituberculatus TaxID=210409 RepID=A0A5B7HUE8_PORTR|nr:hypothetical protein [Portunus trituberculatus]